MTIYSQTACRCVRVESKTSICVRFRVMAIERKAVLVMMDDLCVCGHIPTLALAGARLEDWIQVRAGTEVLSLDDGAHQRGDGRN